MMLKDGGEIRETGATSRSEGCQLRGGTPGRGAVVVRIPGESGGGEASVCGLKAFLIDERRIFMTEGGEVPVDCAKVAVIDILDSPVHVHGETVETYCVLKGRGGMVLGDDCHDLEEGHFVLIPPGVPHGMKSLGPEAVRVLMTFTPGMAPVSRQEFRDEKILAAGVDAYLGQMKAGPPGRNSPRLP